MRHALILLPVLTLGATFSQVNTAHAAPDPANGAPDASVATDNLGHADLEAVLGVRGLPDLDADPVDGDAPDAADSDATIGNTTGDAGQLASTRGVARATYVKTDQVKLPYAKASAKAQAALWAAQRKGDTHAVAAALDGGAEASEANRRDVTPLMAAAKAGQSEVVALLLSRGANLEQADPTGATALHYAVEGRAQECADALLQAGANPNALNLRGETALDRLCASLVHLKASPTDAVADANNTARRQRVVDLMVSLLCYGANPNLAPANSPMPLAIAARSGDVGVVQLLLSGGADATGGGALLPDARGGRWETPLAAVLGAGNRARIESLFLRDGGLMTENLREELRDSAQKNDLAIVKALLDKGAALGEGMDRFALLEASSSASAGGAGGEIVRLLAQRGASPLVDDGQRRLAFNDTLGLEGPRLAQTEIPAAKPGSLLAMVPQQEFEPQLSGEEPVLTPATVITTDESPRTVALASPTPLVAATPMLDRLHLADDVAVPPSRPTTSLAATAPTTPQLTMPVLWSGIETVTSAPQSPPSPFLKTRSAKTAPRSLAAARSATAATPGVEVIEAVGNGSIECHTANDGALVMRLATPVAPEAPRVASSLLTTLSEARIAPAMRPHAQSASARTAAAQAQAAFDAHYGAPQGYTPLIQAARAGQVETVQALLEGGADPNARDAEGKTPLMHLCGTGRAAWVRQLPRRRVEALVGISDADPRAASRVVSYSEKRQWRKWAEDGDMAMVQALVKAGADVNARDHDGRTPLMYAARRSSPGVIRALIAAGADINAQDRVGKTAIMQIIGGGRVPAAAGWVSPLLEREMRHALSVAKQDGSLAATQKAIDSQSRFELHRDLVKQEAERDDDVILCELRRARADLGLRDMRGRTVLDLAVASGQESAIRWLMGDVY